MACRLIVLEGWLLSLPTRELGLGHVIVQAHSMLPQTSGCLESSMLIPDCPELRDRQQCTSVKYGCMKMQNLLPHFEDTCQGTTHASGAAQGRLVPSIIEGP